MKIFFRHYTWHIDNNERAVYLTFDDGPHPVITPWVLNELKKYSAHATFFCVGKNVKEFPEVYNMLLSEGHAVGNHTFNHLNGWKSDDKTYLTDVEKASEVIHSYLFRPPYGKIKTSQANQIHASLRVQDVKIIMWDVLSADFDKNTSMEECFANVKDNVNTGSIIVFHDSEKAFTNLRYSLPRSLEYMAGQGYIFKKIS